MWDFETDPAYQARLDWVAGFVRDQIEPMDALLGDPFDRSDPLVVARVRALQDVVREQGLWACHLKPELGGQGFGQLHLALLNEVLGHSRWAPSIFGCQPPDSGNAEILAEFGTEQQKLTYLRPLLAGDVFSTYAMTEPQGGADPTLFTSRAVRDGQGWRLNGEKWFATNARYAAFLIVMCVTNPEAPAHRRMSMLLVPTATPGLELVRNVGVGTDGPEEGTHGYLRFTDVRLPADALLGPEGEAFAIAQVRLGGGRIHHAMRTIAQLRVAFDLMCERAVSRQVRGGELGSLQMVQEQIADSWLEIEQFRLLVLRTAWLIDRHQDYRAVRKDIAAIKALMPSVFSRVVTRAMHLHGALGVSIEMPFMSMLSRAQVMAVADGPTEVHKVTLARQVLRGRAASPGPWPSGHLPSRADRARLALAELLEQQAASQ